MSRRLRHGFFSSPNRVYQHVFGEDTQTATC
jgi:hypothetical protein